MKKRIVSSLLVLALMGGLCACGGGSDKTSSNASSGEAEQKIEEVVFAYQTFNNIPSEEALQDVEDAVNEITREKIGVEVTLKPIAYADYSNSVSLSLQGGEKIDIFESLGDFSNAMNTEMAADITDLIDEYAPDAKEIVGEKWLEACKFDGRLYGIPTMKPLAMTPMIIYRKDLAEEAGIVEDIEAVKSYFDLTEIFAKVKAAYPDITPLAPVNSGDSGLSRSYEKIDMLSDDFNGPSGVLLNDEMTVVDLYGSDEFRSRCELAREWYNNGYIMKDAATTTSASSELMASGNYFCYLAGYSYPEEDTAIQLEPQCGNYDLGAHIIMDYYLDTATINMVSWMISSNSDVPEAALKFLNLTYADKDIVNLLIYGIEGRDYVMNDDGTVAYPEGEDPTTVPYTAQLSCGTLGNYFIMYQMEGGSQESLDWSFEQNQKTPTSPALGFMFDSSSLKTQYTAVANVINQYLPGLYCGSIDPETEIPKFLDALNDAGYQDILSAKQEQLDAWVAENQ